MVREKEVIELYNEIRARLHYNQDTGALYSLGKDGRHIFLGGDYGTGYLEARFDGKTYLVHRLIYLYMTGEYPPLIDHINRNSRDNRWCNLRSTTKQVNAINSGIPANNTSGIKGVSWQKSASKWTAQIKHNGTKIHLGSYSCLLDAVGARLRAEEELWRDLR